MPRLSLIQKSSEKGIEDQEPSEKPSFPSEILCNLENVSGVCFPPGGDMGCPPSFKLTMLLSLSTLAIVLNAATAKEEVIDDDRSSSYALDSQVEELGPFLSPEELFPLCNTLFERVRKNSNFNPWGGKRAFTKAVLRGLGKKDNSNFNPWGGKRQGNALINRQTKNEVGGDGKKPVIFIPWGGR